MVRHLNNITLQAIGVCIMVAFQNDAAGICKVAEEQNVLAADRHADHTAYVVAVVLIQKLFDGLVCVRLAVSLQSAAVERCVAVSYFKNVLASQKNIEIHRVDRERAKARVAMACHDFHGLDCTAVRSLELRNCVFKNCSDVVDTVCKRCRSVFCILLLGGEIVIDRVHRNLACVTLGKPLKGTDVILVRMGEEPRIDIGNGFTRNFLEEGKQIFCIAVFCNITAVNNDDLIPSRLDDIGHILRIYTAVKPLGRICSAPKRHRA